MLSYYAAIRTTGRKWKLVARMQAPGLCLAAAESFFRAKGITFETVLMQGNVERQKNVIPDDGTVPRIEYDARVYWQYKLTQCHPDSREMFIEAAEREGVTGLRPAPTVTVHFINNETVHNWRARYHGLPYFADLSEAARMAMENAHDRQYDPGTDCTREARKLCDVFAAEFTYN